MSSIPFEIYTAQFKGETVYMVPSDSHPYERGVGDTIHRTLDDAEKERYLNIHRMESREKMQKEIAEQAQKENEQKRERENLQGFGDDKTPLQKGKIVETLRKKVNYKGRTLDRKTLVELKLTEGWIVEYDRFTDKDCLQSPCGDFVLEQKVITKIGIDYAKYLKGGR